MAEHVSRAGHVKMAGALRREEEVAQVHGTSGQEMAKQLSCGSAGSLQTTLLATQVDEVGGQQGGLQVEAAWARPSLDGME